jgi:cyclohexanone monooxygenase
MSRPQYDVAIVGAGFAGMYLLHRCRQLGLTARIWEAGEGVGGTWYWNRYPGARCDIESVQYSYQFDKALQQEWNWSERYAAQPEILRYAAHVADRFSLLDGIEFNHRVRSATFDDQHQLWTLSADGDRELTARYCVMATGCLSAPNWPAIEGYDRFDGPVYHTATWPHDPVDFRNKKVAVIGTGSSGIQSIPLIAEQADQLTVFQRTPNFSVPARNAPLDAESIAEVKNNYDYLRTEAKKRFAGFYGDYQSISALDVSESERQAEYEKRWEYGGLTFNGAFGDLLSSREANDTAVVFIHGKITQVEDPETAALLCPPGTFGSKRLCVDTNYYQTYNRSNVSLVDLRANPIDNINKRGLQAGGEQYDVDVIVMATGFDAITGALLKMDIVGADNTALREQWSDGPSSYFGIAMAGFPNLFTVTGPGSPSVLTNMLPSIEQHVELITDLISKANRQQCRSITVSAEKEAQWWRHVQEVGQQGLKQSTDSWYLGANVEGKARVFMPYNGGLPLYLEKCAEMIANDYEGFAFL